jgi:hypothetical protein
MYNHTADPQINVGLNNGPKGFRYQNVAVALRVLNGHNITQCQRSPSNDLVLLLRIRGGEVPEFRSWREVL